MTDAMTDASVTGEIFICPEYVFMVEKL